MNLIYTPLLEIQHRLQILPRNYARFQEYLRTMTYKDGLELPPLGLMNPMGKEHVTVLLDQLLAMDADGIGAQAAADASAALADIPGEFKIALVVADDLMGGWTNRYDYEFNLRFGRGNFCTERDPDSPSGFRLPKWLKDFWLTALVWSSETPSEHAIRETILLTAHRLAYGIRNGTPRTLRDMMKQEGEVMATVGCTGPVLEPEDIEYTREALIPFLDAEDKRTAIECLFGDEAGRTLGLTPRGLSPWAGIALALHEARETSNVAADLQVCRN